MLIKIDYKIADAKSAAQELGTYFYSTYVKGDGNLPSFDYNFKKEISDISFNDEIVKRYLLKLLNKFSSGLNELPNTLLKNLANAISTPLALIF